MMWGLTTNRVEATVGAIIAPAILKVGRAHSVQLVKISVLMAKV